MPVSESSRLAVFFRFRHHFGLKNKTSASKTKHLKIQTTVSRKFKLRQRFDHRQFLSARHMVFCSNHIHPLGFHTEATGKQHCGLDSTKLNHVWKCLSHSMRLSGQEEPVASQIHILLRLCRLFAFSPVFHSVWVFLVNSFILPA